MPAREGLRGLALWLVFVQHVLSLGLKMGDGAGMAGAVAEALAGYFNYSVELFFILSGYLIYGAQLRRRQGFGRFVRRRLNRLYPTFLAVFLPVAAAHLVIGTGKIAAGAAGLGYLAANVAMLPGLWPMVPLMTVAWTLSYELGFYAALGLGLLVLPPVADGRWRVAGLVVGALGLSGLGMVFGVGGPAIGEAGVPIRMLAFFAGMLLAEAELARLRAPPVWLVLGAIGVSFAMNQWVDMTPVVESWVHTVALGLLCAACLLGRNAAGAAMGWTPLRWLGNMSYSYYLVHGFVVAAVLAGLRWAGVGVVPIGAVWLAMPVVFVVSLVPGVVLFALVERPWSLAPRGGAGAKRDLR